MSNRQTAALRLLLSGRPSAPQLGALRKHIPQFAQFPPVELRRRLAEMSMCVVTRLTLAQAEAARDVLPSHGVGVELFSWREYDAEYLRRILPPPPSSWDAAETRLEVVFRPAFHHESILRIWAVQASAEMQLSTVQASVWVAHFNPPHWLLNRRPVTAVGSDPMPHPNEDTVEQLVPWEECATLDLTTAEELFELAGGLPEPTSTVGLDGIFVTVAFRHQGAELNRELWSPTEETDPRAHRLLQGLLGTATGSLVDPRSQTALRRRQ